MSNDEFQQKFHELDSIVYNHNLSQYLIDLFERIDSEIFFPYDNNGYYSIREIHVTSYHLMTVMDIMDKTKEDYKVVKDLYDLFDGFCVGK